MFTIEQIKAEHSKVKSGADFPQYIRDLKALGILSYNTYVSDGHAEYYGANGYHISSEAKYDNLVIANNCSKEQFITDLKAHQQGNTDYITFCNDAAKSGIEKWNMDLQKMLCTYYDKAGNKILAEQVPS